MVVGINHAVVPTARHDSLALTCQQTAGHGVVVVGALVVRVHVVDVVHDVGHAHGKARTVVVVVGGGRHQPRSGDDRW